MKRVSISLVHLEDLSIFTCSKNQGWPKRIYWISKKKITTPKPLSVMFSFALFPSYITARNFKKLVSIMDTMWRRAYHQKFFYSNIILWISVFLRLECWPYIKYTNKKTTPFKQLHEISRNFVGACILDIMCWRAYHQEILIP